MDKNRVRRREVPGKLAKDSDAPTGSKWLHVNAARTEGKLSSLSGEICPQGQKSAEAIVIRKRKPDEGPNGKGVEKKGVGSGEDSRNL